MSTVVYILMGFILFWALLTDAWGYSRLLFSNDNVKMGSYFYGYASRVVWLSPAIVLILRKSDDLFYRWQALVSKPKINKALLLTLGAMTIYCLIGMLAIHRGVYFNTENLALTFVKMLIVGIVEETVFRGFGYNALCKIASNKIAMILSSLMFALVHCPAYIIKCVLYGSFDIGGMFAQCSIAFLLGFLFCALLRKKKSLWFPIIAHSYYDLLSFLLI